MSCHKSDNGPYYKKVPVFVSIVLSTLQQLFNQANFFQTIFVHVYVMKGMDRK